MKIFTAHYRYRNLGGIGPDDHFVDLTANSFVEAKRIAKGWQGSNDKMTWFMGIEPATPKAAIAKADGGTR